MTHCLHCGVEIPKTWLICADCTIKLEGKDYLEINFPVIQKNGLSRRRAS